jgi:tRNA(Ile)-lysidine synthase
MQEEFRAFLLSLCQDSPDPHFLVAVSGGIDSVVMTHLFHSMNLKFSILHCNFHLRGKESDADQTFVESMAARLNVECYVAHFDTNAFAQEHGISIQMAARDLRYNWFERAALQYNGDYIATGHNENDIIETVLLNFSRGTGIRGLMGIRPINGKLIRPLLFASRERITAYASIHNLRWREDSSNKETKYHRNKIRHTIIPAFESINPAFIQNARSTINRLEQAGKLFDLLLQQIKDNVWIEKADRILIDIRELRKYPSHDLIMFELMRDYGVSHLDGDSFKNLINAESGKQLHTPTHLITKDRDCLIITRRDFHEQEEVILEKETVSIDYPIYLTITIIEDKETFIIPKLKNMASLDADTISFPLKLRTWRSGDRFYPFGLKGSKKISDYLINNKVPLPDKQQIWVLESDGKIIWVVNHRIDDRFKVTEQTSKILLLKYGE